jgi:hypothetical protein
MAREYASGAGLNARILSVERTDSKIVSRPFRRMMARSIASLKFDNNASCSRPRRGLQFLQGGTQRETFPGFGVAHHWISNPTLACSCSTARVAAWRSLKLFASICNG